MTVRICLGHSWEPEVLRHWPHLLQGLHSKVDAAAGSGQRQVLLGHGLHFLHDNVRLLHLSGDLGGFPLQILQGGNDGVVIQNAAFYFVQSLEQRLFELP